eukprot:Gb_01728 [translate_table: standard]
MAPLSTATCSLFFDIGTTSFGVPSTFSDMLSATSYVHLFLYVQDVNVQDSGLYFQSDPQHPFHNVSPLSEPRILRLDSKEEGHSNPMDSLGEHRSHGGVLGCLSGYCKSQPSSTTIALVIMSVVGTKIIGGAVIAAKFCKSNGDYENAIEFLIMSKRTQEAKELAKQQNKMDAYTDFVIDVASKDECLELARCILLSLGTT